MNRTTRVLAALAASTALAACSTAEAVDDDATTPPTTEGTLTVTGVDYGFEGADDPVGAGTTLAFRNDSDAEFHEMVVMRLADDEERTVDELLALPEDEAMQAMTFVGVAGAAPGESGELVDGTLTLDDAGRYVLTCFIPVGADPDVVAAAFAGGGDGPPDLGDGPPHLAEGMVAELVVE